MQQAIVTKYLGPTDKRGAAIMARCADRTIVRPYNYKHSTRITRWP